MLCIYTAFFPIHLALDMSGGFCVLAAECTGLRRVETTCLRAASLSFPCTGQWAGWILWRFCLSFSRQRPCGVPGLQRPRSCMRPPAPLRLPAGAAGPALRIVLGLVGPVLPVAPEPDQQPLTPLSQRQPGYLPVSIYISWC